MERYAETCRFILVCNYSNRIIEPIQSRCAPFRFSPLSDEDIRSRLFHVAGMEGIELTDDGVYAILEECQGDLRKTYNTLQATAALGERVDENSVYNVVGRVHPKEVREMLKFALKGEFIEAREKLRQILHEYGVSASDIIKEVHSEVFRLNLPERWKAILADTIGEVDFRISQGANDEVQFSALLAKFALAAEEIGIGK